MGSPVLPWGLEKLAPKWLPLYSMGLGQEPELPQCKGTFSPLFSHPLSICSLIRCKAQAAQMGLLRSVSAV